MRFCGASPGCHFHRQDLIAAYGMGRNGSLTRMIDTLEDARRLAMDASRRSVTAKDVLSAVDARKLSEQRFGADGDASQRKP